MFVAVHLPILLEDTPICTSAHEVVITQAGVEAAAHCGATLATTITPLDEEGSKNKLKKRNSNYNEILYSLIELLINDIKES